MDRQGRCLEILLKGKKETSFTFHYNCIHFFLQHRSLKGTKFPVAIQSEDIDQSEDK